MVGIAGRSRGCYNCRRRKIKCDEERPACQRCITTNRKCEGYEQDDARFIIYGPPSPCEPISLPARLDRLHSPSSQFGESSRLSDTYEHMLSPVPPEFGFLSENPSDTDNAAYQSQHNFVCKFLDDNSSDYSGSVRGSQSSTSSIPLLRLADQRNITSGHVSPHGSTMSRQIIRLRRDSKDPRRVSQGSSIRTFPMAQHEKIAGKWVHWMDEVLPIHWYYTFRGFGNLLPQRVGRSQALDEAIQCVTTSVFLPERESIGFPDSLHHYARAITHLREEMLDTTKCRSSEVLCATAMLQIYEQRTTRNGLSWIAHSGGAAKLVELRGPEAHASAIGRATLYWLRATIIAQAMKDRRRCFLSQPGWKRALKGGPPDSGVILTGSGLVARDAFEDLTTCAMEYPGILEDANDLLTRATQIAPSILAQTVRRLLEASAIGRTRCKDWRSKYVTRGTGEGEERARQPAYDNPIVAYFDAIMIMLLVTADGLMVILEDKARGLFPQLGVTVAALVPERREVLLNEMRAGGVAMRWAYTIASSHSGAPLRLLDLAFEGLIPILAALPPDIGQILRDARLSEEDRLKLARSGLVSPPYTP